MMLIKNLIRIALCRLKGHDPIFMTREECREKEVMTGVFTPYVCSRCGYKSNMFPYPKFTQREPETTSDKLMWSQIQMCMDKPQPFPPIPNEHDHEEIKQGLVHPSHTLRHSDSSRYDEICVVCGLTDNDDLSEQCRLPIPASKELCEAVDLSLNIERVTIGFDKDLMDKVRSIGNEMGLIPSAVIRRAVAIYVDNRKQNKDRCDKPNCPGIDGCSCKLNSKSSY